MGREENRLSRSEREKSIFNLGQYTAPSKVRVRHKLAFIQLPKHIFINFPKAGSYMPVLIITIKTMQCVGQNSSPLCKFLARKYASLAHECTMLLG